MTGLFATPHPKDLSVLRTNEAGSLRADQTGQTVTLAGWVARRRDHGGVAFLDLRDASGVVQVVARDEVLAEGGAHDIRNEYCVQVTGEVRRRPEGNENADLPTGQVEVSQGFNQDFTRTSARVSTRISPGASARVPTRISTGISARVPTRISPGHQPGFQPGFHPGHQPGFQPGFHPGHQPGFQPGFHPGISQGSTRIPTRDFSKDSNQEDILDQNMKKAMNSIIKKRGDDGKQNRLLSYLQKKLPLKIEKLIKIRHHVYEVHTEERKFILKGFPSHHLLKDKRILPVH